jgi:hypothetical protein
MSGSDYETISPSKNNSQCTKFWVLSGGRGISRSRDTYLDYPTQEFTVGE